MAETALLSPAALHYITERVNTKLYASAGELFGRWDRRYNAYLKFFGIEDVFGPAHVMWAFRWGFAAAVLARKLGPAWVRRLETAEALAPGSGYRAVREELKRHKCRI